MSDSKKAEGIPFTAIINIEVSGGFYARVHQLYYSLCNQASPEEFKQLLELIKQGKSNESPLAYHLETVMTLLLEIEDCAKKQDKINLVDLPQEKQDPPA